MNLAKSFVWWPSPIRPDWSGFPRELQRNNDEGFKILGGAVGTPQYLQRILEAKISKVEITLDKVACLRKSHQQFTLIKYCVNSYKFSHYFKTVNPVHYPVQLIRIDEIISSALADTFGCEITPSDRRWISLPTTSGGLGVPTTVNIAGASFIASRTQSSLLTARIQGKEGNYNNQQINELLQSWGNLHRLVTPISMEELLAASKPQALLCDAINQNTAETLHQNLAPRQQLIFKAMREKTYIHSLVRNSSK